MILFLTLVLRYTGSGYLLVDPTQASIIDPYNQYAHLDFYPYLQVISLLYLLVYIYHFLMKDGGL
jgi:hypothetical protein